jgi:large subunit ribosomal protein L7Ae
MSKPFYVKFEVSKELADAAYEALQIAAKTGTVRKGTNETTKEDVQPPEVVAHLPLLCEERKIPYIFVPNKEKIGSAIGIDVPASAASIVKEGEATGLVKEIVTRLEQMKRGAK